MQSHFKIVSMVLNEVKKDARVLREARGISEKLNLPVLILGYTKKRSSKQAFLKNQQKQLDSSAYEQIYSNIFVRVLYGYENNFDLIKKHYSRSIFIITLIISGILIFQNFSFLTQNPLILISLIYCLSVFLRIFWKSFGLKFRKIEKLDIFFSITKSFIDIFKMKAELIFFKNIFLPQLNYLRPEVIHCHELPMLVVGSEYKLKHDNNVKLVFDSHELHEHILNKNIIHRFFLSTLQKKYLKYADRFITVNPKIADFLKKKYSIQKEITIIYNAVERKKSNIEGDKNSSPLRKAVLQGSINRSNISEPNKIILYQGACTAGRGIEIIVKAMPKINEEWILVIMGWGEYIKYLKILSKKIKVENRIVFLPPASQDELIKWTTGADIGIIPYVNNCLNHLYCSPNKLWEYPFAGVPIIAPDFPFLGYMINKYQIGWTLKEMNPHYLSECINLITKSDLLEKSKKFPHFIEEECWEHSLDRLIKIYTDLLKRIEK